MRTLLPPLSAVAILATAILFVTQTSGRAGPLIVSLGRGHGIHLYDVWLIIGAGFAAIIVPLFLRWILHRDGEAPPADPGAPWRDVDH